MCLFVEKFLSLKKNMRPRAKGSSKEPSRDALLIHVEQVKIEQPYGNLESGSEEKSRIFKLFVFLI